MRGAAAADGKHARAEWSDDQTLLPTQFYRAPECGPYGYGPGSGPRRLMVAVLIDALRHVVDVPQSHYARHQQQQDRRWLMSESAGSLFSFRRICAVLELDPSAVRKGIAAQRVRTTRLRRIYASHRASSRVAVECVG